MIVGKRVRLRRPPDRGWEHEVIMGWRNDPANKVFFYDEEPLSLDSHLAWWDKVGSDPCQRFYLIEALLESGPIVVGTTGLSKIDWRNRTAEYVRFLLAVENRGKGYGLEAEFLLMDYAFSFLNLHKVWGQVLIDNEPVLRLHNKVGFKWEGVLRQCVFKAGEYKDVVMIGLLAEEFYSLREGLVKRLGLVDGTRQ